MTMRVFDLSLHTEVFWPKDGRAYRDGLLREPAVIQGCLLRSRARLAAFKPMLQIQDVPAFLAAYPELRIVWLLRSYPDVVNSCVRKWSGMREQFRSVLDGSAASRWFAYGMSQSQLATLREHYAESISLETAYALFWYLRNSFYFDLNLDQCSQVAVFWYEDLVAAPHAAFASMFDFCGCPFSQRTVTEVHQSSVGKNASPVIAAEVQSLCEWLTARFQSEHHCLERRDPPREV